MPSITFRELSASTYSFLIEVDIEGDTAEVLEVVNPFATEDYQRLNWYFEQYLSEPYIAQSRVAKAKETLLTKGETLFEATLGREPFLSRLQKLKNQYAWDSWVIEIVGESPAFFEIHWEALKQPKKSPFAALGVQYIRKSPRPSEQNAQLSKKATLNLLVVSARPGEEKDVNPHTIQRPLIERTRDAGPSVRPHVLRPGTFKALTEHLDAHPGFYHLIHFDLHGTVISFADLQKRRDEERKIQFYGPQTFQVNWGLADISPYEGTRAFLLFEGDEPGLAVPVPSETLAELLESARIPVCILNACQSAKQPEASQEQSVAKALMDAGLQLVLAMSHSISVTAAELLMQEFYKILLKGIPLEKAISQARKGLFRNKNRLASLGQTIELEDWVLPQVYQNRPVNFNLRELSREESQNLQRARYQRHLPPKPPYGFHGRELDILKIEKLLIDPEDYELRRHLLIRGMMGTGKTALMAYLAWWWEETRWVDRAIMLSIEGGYISWKGLLWEIGKQVFPADQADWSVFQEISNPIELTGMLYQAFQEAGSNWAFLIDNASSQHNSLRESLPFGVAEELKKFLMGLPRNVAVVYSSCSAEKWLSEGTFEFNFYSLNGLRKEAQYQLANAILAANGLALSTYIQTESLRYDFEELMNLSQGIPNILAQLLPSLAEKEPKELLTQFYEGTLWSSFAPHTSPAAYQLFICSAEEDRDAIIPLLDVLQLKKVRIWWDQLEIKIGDSILSKINEGISNSDLCLLVVSPAFFESPMATLSQQAFFALQTYQREKRLLPIWYNTDIEAIREKNFLLADLHPFILNPQTNLEEMALQIIAAITKAEAEKSHKSPFDPPSKPPALPPMPVSRRPARDLLEKGEVRAAIEWMSTHLIPSIKNSHPEQVETFAHWSKVYYTLARDLEAGVIDQEYVQKQLPSIIQSLTELT